jgi:arylsulfatase A-like enzyme
MPNTKARLEYGFVVMSTRNVAALLFIWLALCSQACGAPEPAPEAGSRATTRPNILILMADDWNWPQSQDVVDPNLSTPTFDRIAAEGVRFRNAFVNSPSCTPSRAAFLTGMHPWQLQTGVHLWGALPAEFDVYTDRLEDAGYLVGYSGKGWGPGYLEEARREDNPAGRIVVGEPPGRAWDSRERLPTFEDFLARREEGQPFHFWFNTSEPHRPYDWQSGLRRGMTLEDIVVPPTLPDTEETRTDLADYFYEVELFDAAAGEIVRRLERIGELDNTIVVMTGDNGMPFPRAKMTLYDLGTKVPLAIRWPAGAPGGRVIEDFVTFADLAPTFLEAAGVAPPTAMSARSFLSALESEAGGLLDADRTRAFSSIELHCGRYPMRALRTAEYLYVRNYEPERPINVCATYWESEAGYAPTWISVLALEQASPMYQRIVGTRPAEELYDLATDPYQLENVAADEAYAAVRAHLAAELDAELRRTGDPRVEGRHEQVFYIPHRENAQRRTR